MNAPVSLCRCVYVCLQGWAFVFFRRNKCNLRKGSVVEPCQGVLGTQRQKDWEQEWLCHSHSYNHEKCAVSVRVCVTSENILCSKVAHRNLLLCMNIMLFTSVFRLTCIWLTLTYKCHNKIRIRLRTDVLHGNKGGCELLGVLMKTKLSCWLWHISAPLHRLNFQLESYAGTVYQRPAAPMHLSVVLQHAQLLQYTEPSHASRAHTWADK